MKLHPPLLLRRPGQKERPSERNWRSYGGRTSWTYRAAPDLDQRSRSRSELSSAAPSPARDPLSGSTSAASTTIRLQRSEERRPATPLLIGRGARHSKRVCGTGL
ncbi:hypothetical protein MHYP_G00104240 [Metynnis hypsauchen]